MPSKLSPESKFYEVCWSFFGPRGRSFATGIVIPTARRRNQRRPPYAPAIPTILLIRHGQASFGAADYDELSALGHEQAATLSRALTERRDGIARIVSGSLQRQRDTAAPVAAALGVDLEIDPRWNEYEMDALLAHHSSTTARASRPPGSNQPAVSSAEFQDLLEDALSAWIVAGAESHAPERWPAFAERTRAALDELAADLRSGSTALVFTSGGVIAALCSALLGLSDAALIPLNRVAVNTGMTKIVTGRRGTTLVTFNEHAHLQDGTRSLISYR